MGSNTSIFNSFWLCHFAIRIENYRDISLFDTRDIKSVIGIYIFFLQKLYL